MEISRTEFLPGVGLTAISSDEFKESRLSVHLLTRLSRPNASLCEALPRVLARGSFEHPSEKDIVLALSICHGRLIPGCRRCGEVNDSFLAVSYREAGLLPGRVAALTAAAAVLGEVLQSPRTDGGRLSLECIDPVKAGMLEEYTLDMRARLLDTMCPAEAYGAPLQGTPTSIERLSVGTLTPYYRNTLSSAAIEIIYCGSLSEAHILPAVREAFSALPARRCPFEEAAKVRTKPVKNTVRSYTEPVGAAGAAIGYRMGTAADEVAAAVLKELFRLLGFSAVADGIKGVATVSCTGEGTAAVNAIHDAVSYLASSEVDTELFSKACEAAAKHFSVMLTDCEGMEDFAVTGRITGKTLRPDDLGALALNTDPADISRIAAGFNEDTIMIFTDK